VSRRLWEAVLAAGQEWAAAPASALYSSPLVGAPGPNARGLALWMQHVLAGFGSLAQEPMMTGFLASVVARSYEKGEQLSSLQGQEWRESANRARKAVTLLAAALRAQLPGMPTLAVPYAAQGSPWTTEGFTYRVPWPRQLRLGQDKVDSTLIEAARFLGAPIRQMRLGVLPSPAFAELRDAIAAEPLWTTARSQVENLRSEDRRELSELSRELRLQLRQDAVTRIAGENMLQQSLLREQLVAQALQDERFSTRLGAWQQIFDLLDNALRVLQQIAVFGGIMALQGEVHEADERADNSGTRARIVVDIDNPFSVRGGWAVLVNPDAIPDAIIVESINANVSLTDEPSRLVIEGPLLPEAGTVLRASAVPEE
jgi:hypothetical protein